MLKLYKDDLLLVRSHIKSIIETDNKEVYNIIVDYFDNGGKGLRPLLTLVCGDLGINNKNEIINIASIVEIIHTTTLIHDDIIDKAFERRGKKTLNNIYGDRKALFIGDFLFSRILKEMSKINDQRLHKYLSKTLKDLCLGEIKQYEDLYNIDTRVIDYLRKIRRKTAILIAFACVSGAIVSDATDEEVQCCYKFGYYLGMSYQIIDDYLDFKGNNKKLGKDTGQDLENGNITLPIILKIKKDKDKFVSYKNLTSEEKKKLFKEIKSDSNIMNYTLELSNRYLKKAEESIKYLNSDVKDSLLYILNSLMMRDK